MVKNRCGGTLGRKIFKALYAIKAIKFLDCFLRLGVVSRVDCAV